MYSTVHDLVLVVTAGLSRVPVWLHLVIKFANSRYFSSGF